MPLLTLSIKKSDILNNQIILFIFYMMSQGKAYILTEVRPHEAKFKQPQRRIDFILKATMSS